MSSSEQDRAAHRRKLIKAAVGAPVVFTLPSGAALAATSLSCAEKGASAENGASRARVATAEDFAVQPMQTFSSAPSDTWVRFKLDKYRFAVPDGGPGQGRAFVYGFWYNNQWYQVSQDGSTATPVVPFASPAPEQVLNQSYYGLVAYQNGSIILATSEEQSVAAITASCMASINPEAAQSMLLG